MFKLIVISLIHRFQKGVGIHAGAARQGVWLGVAKCFDAAPLCRRGGGGGTLTHFFFST